MVWWGEFVYAVNIDNVTRLVRGLEDRVRVDSRLSEQE